MLWIVLSIVCAVYYAAVRYVAQSQQLTGIWLILAVLFLLSFLWNRYRKYHPPEKKTALWVRTACWTSLALALLMTGVVAGRILLDMWSSPPEDLAFIILLNQNDMAGESDQEWEARMDEAIQYLYDNEQAKVIVSGGWDKARGYSEAHAMYAYLLEYGVEGNRVFWEIRSEGTKENLDYARSLCNGQKYAVGIVSSDYSMYRTLRIARNQGYAQAEPIPTPTTPWLYPHRIAQEILQVLYDKFFGI